PVRELRALLLAGLHLALLLDAALGRLRPAPGRAALLLRLSVLRLAAGHLLRLVHRALPSADLRPLPLPVSAQHRRSRRPKRGAHMAANRHRQDSLRPAGGIRQGGFSRTVVPVTDKTQLA